MGDIHHTRMKGLHRLLQIFPKHSLAGGLIYKTSYKYLGEGKWQPNGARFSESKKINAGSKCILGEEHPLSVCYVNFLQGNVNEANQSIYTKVQDAMFILPIDGKKHFKNIGFVQLLNSAGLGGMGTIKKFL